MATLLDFSNFTFSDEEVRSVNEMVMDELITSPELNLIHTIFPNIKIDKEIGFIGEGGLVGKARQGCSPTPQAWNIGSRMLKWTPSRRLGNLDLRLLLGFEEHGCRVFFEDGYQATDFTSTDYINIVVEVLSIAMKEMIWRMVWFGTRRRRHHGWRRVDRRNGRRLLQPCLTVCETNDGTGNGQTSTESHHRRERGATQLRFYPRSNILTYLKKHGLQSPSVGVASDGG